MTSQSLLVQRTLKILFPFSFLLQLLNYICCHDLCVQSIISLQFFIHFVHLQFHSSMCLWYPDIFESNKRSLTTAKVKIYNMKSIYVFLQHIKSHFVSFSSGNGFLWNKNIIHFQERQSNQMVKTMCLIPLWEYHIVTMEKNLIENWILWNIEITILKNIPTPQWFYSLHSLIHKMGMWNSFWLEKLNSENTWHIITVSNNFQNLKRNWLSSSFFLLFSRSFPNIFLPL